MSKPSTQEAILLAATHVFAEKGYGESRVDEIARRAGVNKATLYYHVGDKDALYAAVMERVLGATAERVLAAVESAEGPEERLRAFIMGIADMAGEMGYAAPIIMREVASGGRHLPEVAIHQMGRIVNVLRQVLEAGVAQGAFRPVNPFVTHMLIVGSILFYACNGPIRARITAQNRSEFGPDHFVSNQEIGREVANLLLASVSQPKQEQ